MDNILGFLISSKAQSLHRTRSDRGALEGVVTANVRPQYFSHTLISSLSACAVFFVSFLFFHHEEKCGMWEGDINNTPDHKFIIIALLW